MPDRSIIDYYAILNVPYNVNLAGVENAYARLSDDLVRLAEVDPNANQSLKRLNEAYGVLSRPDVRRQYDAAFFAEERALEEQRVHADVRRSVWKQRAIVGGLVAMLAAEGGAALYFLM